MKGSAVVVVRDITMRKCLKHSIIVRTRLWCIMYIRLYKGSAVVVVRDSTIACNCASTYKCLTHNADRGLLNSFLLHY